MLLTGSLLSLSPSDSMDTFSCFLHLCLALLVPVVLAEGNVLEPPPSMANADLVLISSSAETVEKISSVSLHLFKAGCAAALGCLAACSVKALLSATDSLFSPSEGLLDSEISMASNAERRSEANCLGLGVLRCKWVDPELILGVDVLEGGTELSGV